MAQIKPEVCSERLRDRLLIPRDQDCLGHTRLPQLSNDGVSVGPQLLREHQPTKELPVFRDIHDRLIGKK
jgi:hypothetical protein